MKLTDELKQIKKKYGEEFMHLCREFFPTILEEKGMLLGILNSTFAENCTNLSRDLKGNKLENEFKEYIYTKINMKKGNRLVTDKTPYELLEEAGYKLYECKTEEEIQSFQKYYAPREKLCTFNGGRLDKCVVFFAIKKNVEEIKREDFVEPEREDEYGTSVMSIQFYKKGICTVSIKNRYNHAVGNPDATFGNDLERIIPGLTNSFEKLLNAEYNLELDSCNIEELEIPGYVVAGDGKYYKYNMEINGKYYCPKNIIIDGGQVHKLGNSESMILMDYFILDIQHKQMYLYDPTINDSFIDGFEELQEEVILREKNKQTNGVVIQIKKGDKIPIIIEIDNDNQIVSYENKVIENIEDNFFRHNVRISRLELPIVRQIGDRALYDNVLLQELILPRVEKIGDDCLIYNKGINYIELPQLLEVGNNFMSFNTQMVQLKLERLQKAGDNFIYYNQGLIIVELQNLQCVGDNFLGFNKKMTHLRLPNLQYAQENFLHRNRCLEYLEVPKCPKLLDELSCIIDRNMQKQKTEMQNVITPQIVANLDECSKLTTSEVERYLQIMERNDKIK